MKRVIAFISILIIILSFTACGKSQVNSINDKVLEKLMTEYKALKDLPESYNAETANGNGDVVTVHGKDYNVEKLDAFMKSLEKKKPAMVRITHYTIEGDAIVKDLIYDGESILLNVDNTRDKFSAAEDRKVIDYKISDIIASKSNDGTQYEARLKNGEIMPIAWITSK